MAFTSDIVLANVNIVQWIKLNTMKRITIKAAFKDHIERMIWRRNEIDNFGSDSADMQKTIYKDTDIEKEELIEALQNCISYKVLSEDTFEFVIERPEEEKKARLDELKCHLQLNFRRLQWWMDRNEEDKKQIVEYLQFRKLDWILNQLNY